MTNYEFNPFTGRLKESTKFQPYYPLKPSRLNTTEQTLIWDTMATKPAEIKSPGASTSVKGVDPSLSAKYKHFQRDVHKPVYIMGGTKDRILFGLAITLTAVAAADAGKLIYDYLKKN